MSERASVEVEVVSWREHRIGLAAVFAANSLFSLICLSIALASVRSSINNQQTVNVDSDPERTKIIKELSKEYINARLHDTVQPMASGPDHGSSRDR